MTKTRGKLTVSNPIKRWDYFFESEAHSRTDPLRHDDEDLHFGQIRSPVHSLGNGRRQARQSRTFGAISPSGSGFL
jgi:hypothetical protein